MQTSHLVTFSQSHLVTPLAAAADSNGESPPSSLEEEGGGRGRKGAAVRKDQKYFPSLPDGECHFFDKKENLGFSVLFESPDGLRKA